MTLRWRLTLFYTGLLAALLTAVAVAALLLMQNSLVGNLDRELQLTSRNFIDTASRLELDTSNFSRGPDAAGTLSPVRYLFPNEAIQVEELAFYDAGRLRADLRDAQARGPEALGQLFGSVRAQLNGTRRPPIGLDRAAPLQLEGAELTRLIEASGGQIVVERDIKEAYGPRVSPYRFLVTLGPVKLDAGGVGGPSETLAVVYVGRSLEGIASTLAQLRQVIVLLFLAGLVTAGVGAYVLAGRAMQPLRQVQRAAERIGGQNLAERVPEPPTGDEVESLARALNAMLGRLEASFEAQRRFTSDASHELRTPVTAISGHASYLLRRTAPTGQQRESLNIIRSESGRLTNLIASLLQLARSDSGALTLTRQPILSNLFLEEVARELAPLAQAQGTTLGAAGQDVVFEGDPDRLRQVIINLVGNALKAGATHVTLTSEPQEGGREVRLSVADDGPGIPAEHLGRLFDRFYRVEDSRSRDQGGAGLGLSIAKGIVEAHGGRIWLESEVGRGTTAHVQLPVGDVPEPDDDVP